MASRHVVSTPELTSRGFLPIHGRVVPMKSSSTGTTADPQPPPCVVGISNGLVDVISSRGSSIGTEEEMDGITDLIEMVANVGGSEEHKTKDKTKPATGIITTGSSNASTVRRRRLLPPEIVFPGAYVAICFRSDGIAKGEAAAEGEEGGKEPSSSSSSSAWKSAAVELRFDARSALVEWAEAHGPLPAPTGGASTALDDASTCSIASIGVESLEGNRGVAIMRSVDAALWSERGRGGGAPSATTAKTASSTRSGKASSGEISLVKSPPSDDQEKNKASKSNLPVASSSVHSTASSGSDFRYDWTYSTPYGGTVAASTMDDGPRPLLNGRNLWKDISTSGIDMSLLSDRTQPILYFDDVALYEDDLHDNGVSHLNVKIRVMPKCLFVLYRLFVRVDYVAIRVRDVRVFHKFGSKTIYRDITWRECSWDKLLGVGLPDDVGRWRVEDATTQVSVSIQALVGRIPEQKLPPDVPLHSKIDVGGFVS